MILMCYDLRETIKELYEISKDSYSNYIYCDMGSLHDICVEMLSNFDSYTDEQLMVRLGYVIGVLSSPGLIDESVLTIILGFNT